MAINDSARREEIEEEPDPLAAFPEKEVMAAALRFADGMAVIKRMAVHRERTGECLHCWTFDYCPIEAALYGMVTGVGGSLLANPDALTVLDALNSPTGNGFRESLDEAAKAGQLILPEPRERKAIGG